MPLGVSLVTLKVIRESMGNKSAKIFETTQNYLQTIVAPQAAKIAKNPETLKQVLKGMGERYLLALKIPEHLDGAGFTEQDYARFQVLIARYSGTLAFLQTQHQSAASMIASSNNQQLQQKYLPYMSGAKKLVGVGFSQLRRLGNPMMKAQPVETGYLLEGEIPWITGWNFFDSFIVGATLSDGREVYGMLPLENQQQSTGGTINLSPPMNLIGMASTNTVSAYIKEWLLEDKQVIAIKAAGSIHKKSQKNVLHHGFFAVGCAQGALDILKTSYETKQLSFIKESWQILQTELDDCYQQMLDAITDDNYPAKLKLRGWAINLVGRCAHAAVIASSGAANYEDHPAGRVYREALLFSVSGQTTDVMAESLNYLNHSNK